MNLNIVMIEKIKSIVEKDNPTVRFEYRYDVNEGDLFLIVNDEDLYYSDDFLILRNKIFEEIIWSSNLPNTYFVYEKNNIVHVEAISVRLLKAEKWTYESTNTEYDYGRQDNDLNIDYGWAA